MQRSISIHLTRIALCGCLLSSLGALNAMAGNAAKQRSAQPTTSNTFEPFGLRLANAALARRWVPVVYNAAYVKIAYPGGDVPWYTGVCTDVVVRSYRTLGIDLQVKVHKSRVGSGDRNIDHRRVNVLRKFFARKGKSLSTAKNPALYQPGDIVTMYLPNGTSSKTHVAIVTQHKSSAGVPLVVHNRGYGVQLEDWLFARKITGHYRYKG
ncbi:MAG: hypothetical protein ACI89J_000411 [Hyphomicrobiaceae bacterium]|jgi:uncharacterized protein YijF (DUF1287 family)